MSTEAQAGTLVKMGVAEGPRSGELAATASAALAKATIEAKFTVALHRPRSVLNARSRLLDACKRPKFADAAIYSKPVGKQAIEGLSIRFAETALQAWGNVDTAANVVFEDESKRVIRITVTDLETNISYSDESILDKTVERRNVKPGTEVLGERTNSYGDKVFIVRATEDELLNKVNAAKSKAIRNSGLRLIPQDILDEAKELCEQTIVRGGDDPAAATKQVCDAFQTIGVYPRDLESHLGHSLQSITPKEIANLRKVYAAIRDGEASWNDYARREAEPQPAPAAAPKPGQRSSGAASEPGKPTSIPGKEADDVPMTFPTPSGTAIVGGGGGGAGSEKTSVLQPAATGVPAVAAAPTPAAQSGQAPVQAPVSEDLASLIVAAANEKGCSFDKLVEFGKWTEDIPEDAAPADASELPAAFVAKWGPRLNALKRQIDVFQKGGAK